MREQKEDFLAHNKLKWQLFSRKIERLRKNRKAQKKQKGSEKIERLRIINILKKNSIAICLRRKKIS